MKKKLLSLLLAMVLLLLLTPFAMATEDGNSSGSVGENFSWSFDSATATLTLSGTGPMPLHDPHAYPWTELWSEVEHLRIEEGITSVSAYAFANFKFIRDVQLPDSLKSLDYAAFQYCAMLEEITLPRNVSTVGQYAFFGCNSLVMIYVAAENPDLYSDSKGVLYSKNMEILYLCPPRFSGGYVIPNGVKRIASEAFRDCSNLTSVTIPDGVMVLEERTFWNCPRLKWVSFPSDLKKIDFGAFSGCSSLIEINLPEGLEYIGQSAFSGTESLVSISLPKSLTFIGLSAFSSIYSYDSGHTVHITYSGTKDQLAQVTIEGNGGMEILQRSLVHDNTPGSKVYRRDQNGEKKLYCAQCDSYLTVDFADVPEDAYYWAPVHWAKNRNITTGVTETSYGPDQVCTRAQIVTFLYRLAGSPSPQSYWKNPFTDVSPDAYYYNAVRWAVFTGIAKGMTETEFCPEALCTRGQAMTFLWRYCEMPEYTAYTGYFTDISAEAYYYEAVLWAVDQDITNGVGNGKFAPDQICTRGQIITFLFYM
ncbi:MAG: leucine-rich repeat protein [Oscillospiraceae bacterium]|nr:leucine-rich repeat protein [Oscillospiraceae bacterium]